MKRTFTLIILLLSLNSFSQTQAEMNQQAYDDFHESDDTLNEIYQAILSDYKNDTLFINNLKKSQRIWIEFRDAEMEMKYPQYSDKFYGSIHPLCRATYLKELTDNRIQTLLNWVRGTEGEVCNGSIKIFKNLDPKYMGKAFIAKDSSVVLNANMKKDHRIFGYKKKDIYSEKMILLSIFTNEVENNPFDCEYGAYYDTSGMDELSLKYLATEGEFFRVAVLKNDRKIDEVFMLKNRFDLEK